MSTDFVIMFALGTGVLIGIVTSKAMQVALETIGDEPPQRVYGQGYPPLPKPIPPPPYPPPKPRCAQCRGTLSDGAISAGLQRPTGTHDRGGRWYCDACWAAICAHWHGHDGVVGLPGYDRVSPPPEPPQERNPNVRVKT